MKDFIRIENLYFQYEASEEDENRSYALNGVDLSIGRGEFVAV